MLSPDLSFESQVYRHMEELYVLTIGLKARVQKIERRHTKNRKTSNRQRSTRNEMKAVNQNSVPVTYSRLRAATKRLCQCKRQIAGNLPNTDARRTLNLSSSTRNLTQDRSGATVWMHTRPRPTVSVVSGPAQATRSSVAPPKPSRVNY